MYSLSFVQLHAITFVFAAHSVASVLHGARTGMILYRLRRNPLQPRVTGFSNYPGPFFWLQVALTAFSFLPGGILLIFLWCHHNDLENHEVLARCVLVAIIICNIFTDCLLLGGLPSTRQEAVAWAWVRPVSHLMIAAMGITLLIAGQYVSGESLAAICTIIGLAVHRLSMLWSWFWYLIAAQLQGSNFSAVLSFAAMHFTAFCAVFLAFLEPLESLLNRLLVLSIVSVSIGAAQLAHIIAREFFKSHPRC